MQDNLFRGVEREFYSYTENCRYLETLEERKKNLPTVRSSSDFNERVDTGTNYSDPVSIWFEKVEFLEEQIARYRLRTIPISKMLLYLEDCEPEMLRLFNLRYVQQKKWVLVEAEMGLSEKVRFQMRKRLILKGARFIGMKEGV
ncbi:MAG: hypothetical protein EOM17_08005 [Synergistales bacterium]|nr:hypothetical protein [Synergistales bacterium]